MAKIMQISIKVKHTLLQDEQASDQLRGLLVDTYLSAPVTHIPKVLPIFIGMVATRLFA